MSLPTNVTYLSVIHPYPYLFGWGRYNAGQHALVAIVFSNNYNGKAFVAAKFADGQTYLYYGTTILPLSLGYQANPVMKLILQSVGGIVMPNVFGLPMSVTDMGDVLVQEVEQLGPTWSAVNSAGSVTVKSPAGVHYVPVVTVDSAHGLVAATVQAFDYPGQLQAAWVKFGITPGTDMTTTAPFTIAVSQNPAVISLASVGYKADGTYFYFYTNVAEPIHVIAGTLVELSGAGFLPGPHKVVAIGSDVNGNYFTVLSATTHAFAATTAGKFEVLLSLCTDLDCSTVAGGTSAEKIAAAITLLSVNVNSSAFGYTSIPANDTIFVYAPQAYGAWTGYMEVFNTSGTVLPLYAGGTLDLSVTLKPTALLVNGKVTVIGGVTITKSFTVRPVTATASGGTVSTGYTYLWSYVSGDVVINADTPTNPKTTFTRPSTGVGKFKATWQLTVSDNDSPVNTATVNIDVEYDVTIA